jgi:hypothetical protein
VQGASKLLAPHSGHDDIGNDEAQIGAKRIVEKLERALGVRRLENVEALIRQGACREGTHLRVVVNHEDGAATPGGSIHEWSSCEGCVCYPNGPPGGRKTCKPLQRQGFGKGVAVAGTKRNASRGGWRVAETRSVAVGNYRVLLPLSPSATTAASAVSAPPITTPTAKSRAHIEPLPLRWFHSPEE